MLNDTVLKLDGVAKEPESANWMTVNMLTLVVPG
jgi:hypothetical protein